MTSTTLRTPEGGKLRTATKRAYALVLVYPKLTHDRLPTGLFYTPSVSRRSDDPNKLVDIVRREKAKGHLKGARCYIFDTRDGSLLKVLDGKEVGV